MTTLIHVQHDLRTNTLEAVLANEKGERCYCANFTCHSIEELRAVAGPEIEKYIALAGWTPEYIASVKKKEEDEAAEKKAIADAEEAKRKAKRAKEEKAAFDADVARQVAVLEAAKKIVDSKK